MTGSRRKSVCAFLLLQRHARSWHSKHTDQVDAEKHRAMIEELDLEEQQTRGTWGNQAQALQSNPNVP